MAVNLTKVLPPSVLNSLTSSSVSALDTCFKLRQIYVDDLKKHNVLASGLPLDLGESDHFKHLRKPRGSPSDVKEFLTVSFKGFYALFLGVSIMSEKQQGDKPVEKSHLQDVQFEFTKAIVCVMKELRSLGYPIPKTHKSTEMKNLQTRLERLIKEFIRDPGIRALIPPFLGEEDLLLKWGLVHDYIICLATFLNKIGKRLRSRSI